MARCLGAFLLTFSWLALVAHLDVMSELFAAAAFVFLMIHLLARRFKIVATQRPSRVRPEELV